MKYLAKINTTKIFLMLREMDKSCHDSFLKGSYLDSSITGSDTLEVAFFTDTREHGL